MMNKDANDDTAPPEAPVNLELSSESIDSNGKRQISV
jgi:hypothetical protein